MQILQIGLLSVTVQLMGVSGDCFSPRHAYVWACIFSGQVAFDHCVENEWDEMNGGAKLGRISSWPPAFHTKQKRQMGQTDCPVPHCKVRMLMKASLVDGCFGILQNATKYDIQGLNRKCSHAIFLDIFFISIVRADGSLVSSQGNVENGSLGWHCPPHLSGHPESYLFLHKRVRLSARSEVGPSFKATVWRVFSNMDYFRWYVTYSWRSNCF